MDALDFELTTARSYTCTQKIDYTIKPKCSDAIKVDLYYSLHHICAATQQEVEPMQPRRPEEQQNIKRT